MNVYVTGGTGFLGKQLIYDLTKESDVGKVYLQVREKPNEPSVTRFEKCIQEIKKHFPEFSSDKCSFSNEVPEDTNVVIYNGYNVDFFQKVKDCIIENVKPIIDSINGLKCPNLKKIIIVSTAFVTPSKSYHNSVIDFNEDAEKIYSDILNDRCDIKKCVKHQCSLINTYIFSKTLLENLVDITCKKKGYGLTIIRPTGILMSSDLKYSSSNLAPIQFIKLLKYSHPKFIMDSSRPDPIYVDYVSRHIIRNMTSDNHIVYANDGNNEYTYTELKNMYNPHDSHLFFDMRKSTFYKKILCYVFRFFEYIFCYLTQGYSIMMKLHKLYVIGDMIINRDWEFPVTMTLEESRKKTHAIKKWLDEHVFYKKLDPIDRSFYLDDKSNRMNICSLLCYDGIIDYDKYIEASVKNINYKFMSSVKKIGNDYYWKHIPKFDPRNYYKKLEIGDISELHKFIERDQSQPFEEGTPLWRNYFAYIDNKTYVYSKINHAIGDGVAIISYIDSFHDKPLRPSLKNESRVSETNYLAIILHLLAGFIFKVTDKNVLKVRENTGDKKIIFSTIKQSDFDEHRKKWNCNFHDMMLVTVTDIFKKIVKSGDTVSLFYTMGVNKDGLGNNFVPLNVSLPVHLPYEEIVKSIKNTTSKLRSGFTYYLARTMTNIAASLPFGLAPLYRKYIFDKYTCILSTLPSSGEVVAFDGVKLESLHFIVPQLADVKVGISTFTYNGNINLAIITDESSVEPALLLPESICF